MYISIKKRSSDSGAHAKRMAYCSIFHNYELSIYDHTWSAAHCLPNSMHPIDVLTGTAAIWKIKDKWHWISNTEWQCFLMEGTRRYLQNTVSPSTFIANALHIYTCVGRCTLNDEISHWSRLFFSEKEINGKDLGVRLKIKLLLNCQEVTGPFLSGQWNAQNLTRTKNMADHPSIHLEPTVAQFLWSKSDERVI